MRTIVYPNPKNFVISDASKQPIFTAEHHPLQLSDAERIKITQAFLRKLPLCCLTRRADRIIIAIFNQTIDFNKFEDDMNGKRLQQLTTLFPHHANEVVRNLEALHVLISRKGHFGKYLSINFNLSQWGKEECDDVITNDPRIMLNPDHEDFQSKRVPLAQNNAFEEEGIANTASTESLATAVNSAIQQENSPADYSHDLLKDLLVAIGRIEVNQNDLSKRQVGLEKTIERLVNKHIEKLFNKTLEKTIEELINKALAKEKQAEQKQVAAQIPTIPEVEAVIESAVESETKPAKTPTPVTTASSINVINNTELCFPSQLSQDQCHDAKKLLQRVDNDKTQILLDMLGKRLRNTSNPVKKPIAYLTNLVDRLNNNRLDMPNTTGSTAPAKPRPLREAERRRAEYQEAVADCIQMEQNIKLLGRKDSLTFQESLDKFDLRGLWRSIRDRFTETKEALAAIQPLDGEAV